MTDKPNVDALMDGRVSGAFQEWPTLRREVAQLLRENARFRLALIRLRDCDWVITPHDRMDAVRNIAKEALETEKI